MFAVLLAKEWRESLRTARFWILAAIMLISGFISPVLAYYTPALLRTIPDVPEALAAMIPDPTVKDAVAQYVKNAGQFGTLLVIILTMGIVAQEKERGTAAMLLVRPVRRSAVVLAKWIVGMLTCLIGVALGGIGCLLYTAALFELLPIGPFLILNLFLWIFLGVYLSLALLASALARTQGMAAAGAFGALAIMLIISSLPRISDFTPAYLLNWGSALLLNIPASGWAALIVAIAIIAICLALACLRIEREEI
jgi:ABC-2 type transport system permease protein